MRISSAAKVATFFSLFTAVCLFAQAPTSAPANLTGNWKWTMDGPNGDQFTTSAVFKQDADKITGTITDGFDGSQIKIEEGKIKDGMVSLKYSRDFNGNTIVFNYSGKPETDAIKGKLAISFGGQEGPTMDWNAKRSKDAPATAPAAK